MPTNPLAADLDTMLAAMGDTWEVFRDARLFITGGTGYFGRWLLELFMHANAQYKLGATAVVLSRNPDGFIAQAPHLTDSGAIRFHHGDVRHLIPPAGPFTHIIHAATDSCGAQKGHDRLYLADTIVTGTRHMLEMARAQRARMLYVSTSAVYGRSRTAPIPIAENDAAAPLLTDRDIEYDESKRMAEAFCMLYHREFGVPVAIARCFSSVGPHLPLDAHFAIGNFIRDALQGKPVQVNGDGSPVRSYLYAADQARWLWTLLAHGKPAHPYNVGSDEEVSIAGLSHRVRDIVNPGGKVEITGKANGGPINYQVPDIARAEEELNLRPIVKLDEAIRRTVEWNRATPAAATMQPASPSPLAAPDVIIFDFDGVMTDNRVIVGEDGYESVACDRSDGLGIGLLRARGVPMLVLSKESNPVVMARCKKLGLECLHGIDDKAPVLAQWLKERGYDARRTIYVGNDINDLGCMRLVGFPVAVGDAYAPVKAVAALVLTRHGGKGAVRELVDRILGAGHD